jgi:predicted O-methyltransferase YrrM
MNGEASKVLKKLERMAEKESPPSIGPVKGKVIKDVIQDYKPRRILEIGTCNPQVVVWMLLTKA